MREALADAVFLDDAAFSSAGALQRYHLRILEQQRRIRELEAVAEALRAEVAAKDEALAAARDAVAAADGRAAELQREVDATAAVFDLHYQELMLKAEEIERLKAVVEGLGGGDSGTES